jgi:hypothetical protein
VSSTAITQPTVAPVVVYFTADEIKYMAKIKKTNKILGLKKINSWIIINL